MTNIQGTLIVELPANGRWPGTVAGMLAIFHAPTPDHLDGPHEAFYVEIDEMLNERPVKCHVLVDNMDVTVEVDD